MKITSKTINYTVPTVDDLSSMSGQDNDTVIVTDKDRGGVFIYRTDAGLDDGGITFNKWVRQYEGPVNVKWFGAKTGVENENQTTEAFIRALELAENINSFVKVDDGEFWINKELTLNRTYIVGSSLDKTILRCDNIGSELETATMLYHGTAYKLFEYERPTKALLNIKSNGTRNSSFTIKGSGIFGKDDETLDLVPNICAIRGRWDESSSEDSYTISRFTLDNILVKGLHTGYDLNGFIGSINAVRADSCKIGLLATEFNNITADIKMEAVQTPAILYGCTCCTFDSFINEGSITMKSIVMNKCNNIIFNTVYNEGGTEFNDAIFSIGELTPIDDYIERYIDYYAACNDIKINGMNFSYSSDTLVNIDRCNGVDVSGRLAGYSRKVFKLTKNSKNVTDNIEYLENTIPNYSKKDKKFSNAIQLFPNPTLKKGWTGVTDYTDYDKLDVEVVKNDGDIFPITGTSMNKVSIIDGSTGTPDVYLATKHEDILDMFNLGDTVTFGAWIYVPYNEAYNIEDSNSCPSIKAILYYTDGTGTTKNTSMRTFDDWVFVSVESFVIDKELSFIGVQIGNRYVDAVTDDMVLYIDSIVMVRNCTLGRKMSEFDFVTLDSPFAVDNGDYFKYLGNLGGQYKVKYCAGDRINNTDTTDGAFLELVCNNDGDRPDNGSWGYVGIPDTNNIPTSNQGAGTVWSNDGVLTLGS